MQHLFHRNHANAPQSQEYEELTSKLHDFSEREQNLHERLGHVVSTPPPPPSEAGATTTNADSAATTQGGQQQATQQTQTLNGIQTEAQLPAKSLNGGGGGALTPLKQQPNVTVAPAGNGGQAAIVIQEALQPAVAAAAPVAPTPATASAAAPSNPTPVVSSLQPPESPGIFLEDGGHDQSATPRSSSSSSAAAASASTSSTSASGGVVSHLPPKSPVRTIVRAHLGTHGHTFVPTKPGITMRDALTKAMKLRKLAPETCTVYKLSDPLKVLVLISLPVLPL